MRLGNRCCSPIWQNSPLFLYFSRLSPRLYPYPPRLSSLPTSRRNPLRRVQRRFSPDMTSRGSPIAMGSALRNAGQLLEFSAPFSLHPHSLSLPTSDLIYTRTPHYQHPRIDTAAATPSLGPAFNCANEGNLLSGSQVHRGSNPAVLEPISAPFALALASVT